MAAHISGDCCEHGTVTLELYDASGKVIARAAMPISSFAVIVVNVTDDVNAHGLNLQSEVLQ